MNLDFSIKKIEKMMIGTILLIFYSNKWFTKSHYIILSISLCTLFIRRAVVLAWYTRNSRLFENDRLLASISIGGGEKIAKSWILTHGEECYECTRSLFKTQNSKRKQKYISRTEHYKSKNRNDIDVHYNE